MSIPTTSPATSTPDRQNLEPLQELKLKGFGSCNNTPSSKTASLPTPGGASVPLANSAVIDDAPLGELTNNKNNEWGLLDYDPFKAVPGAPLLKDLDSFTEGTGVGSFDSIPCAETDERGNILPRLSEACLSMVSSHCKDAYVLSWLENVSRYTPQASSVPFLFPHDSAHYQQQHHDHHDHNYLYYDYHRVPTLKRPRSMTECDEYRPRRPRTRSCPSSRQSNSLEPD
ncbi:hypothetical protein D9756_006729 [Leucocoprinus leucothites]|uniref:Uncharacterized protein n=1 Tax=Leucocoprinus leucothites TaxID=201217 RepID=A0A8H5G1U1_9AGAR|nr:hypothetical protein D9756_006729 [Leucoagaricus leucothites]